MNPKLMTLKEFAQHIGVSYSTVRRMVADKSVRVVMPHRRAMIPVCRQPFRVTKSKNLFRSARMRC
jgi:excisionase family DNA binding protein